MTDRSILFSFRRKRWDLVLLYDTRPCVRTSWFNMWSLALAAANGTHESMHALGLGPGCVDVWPARARHRSRDARKPLVAPRRPTNGKMFSSSDRSIDPLYMPWCDHPWTMASFCH